MDGTGQAANLHERPLIHQENGNMYEFFKITFYSPFLCINNLLVKGEIILQKKLAQAIITVLFIHEAL